MTARAVHPVALVALCAGIAAPRAARAEAPVDRPQAFEVDRDQTPPGRAELGFDSGAPVGAWALSLQLGYLERPFTLRTSQLLIVPVERRETLALGGAVSIGSGVVLDARLPLAHQAGDRLRGLGDSRPIDRWVPEDLSLGARARLAALSRGSVFARGQLTLGTGDDRDFAGEARYTVAWSLIGRFTLPRGVVLAASGGVRFRRAEVVVADRLLGDELFGGVGATLALPALRGVWCDASAVRLTAELVGVLGNDVGGRRGPSPAEARVGLVGRFRPTVLGALRVGTGLGDQVGSPRVRVMAELVFSGP